MIALRQKKDEGERKEGVTEEISLERIDPKV
jgi:hypothetical protein